MSYIEWIDYLLDLAEQHVKDMSGTVRRKEKLSNMAHALLQAVKPQSLTPEQHARYKKLYDALWKYWNSRAGATRDSFPGYPDDAYGDDGDY